MAGPTFAELLRQLRESRSLTQEELAERAGVTVKAVGALERGERLRPYPHTVRSLADGLGLTDDERAALVASVPARGGSPVASKPEPSQSDPAQPAPVATQGRLIGRHVETAALLELLRAPGRRLVTVTGPGGVGKTSLVAAVVAGLDGAAEFPGGSVVVELASVREPALVLPRVAAALGVPPEAETGSAAGLAPYLQGRRMLVVLDNLEQVLGVAPALADLVTSCPDLVVLATSRSPLRLRLEQVVPLGPLDAGAAVELFHDRAAAAGAPSWGDDAVIVEEICRRLDGLPLAVELVASARRLLSAEALLVRLTETMAREGPRDLPDRQRTMHGTLDWSHDLLEPEEQELFARLAAFADGFTLDGAEAVAAPDADVLGVLTALVDQALVAPVPGAGAPRFRLLEPVRQYAAELLAATGLAGEVADRHAAHLLEVTRTTSPQVRDERLVPALDRLDAELANLRSAYLRLLETGHVDDAVELAWRSWLHLALRGRPREGLSWLARLDGVRLGAVAAVRRDVAVAGLLYVTGDVAAMAEQAREAVRVGRGVLGAPAAEAAVLAGSAAVLVGRIDEAGAHLDEALLLAERDGDAWAGVHALIAQGQRALLAGDLDAASAWLIRSETAARALGNAFSLATALNVRATLTALQGDHVTTVGLLGESTALSVAARVSWTLAYSVPALAGVAAALDQLDTAAVLFGASASLSATHAIELAFPTARAMSDQGLAEVRRRLGDAAFARGWDAGRVASREDVAALAVELSRRAPG